MRGHEEQGKELVMIEDFQHVSITCRDIERSINFYQRLGLRVIKRTAEVSEDGIAKAFQLPAGHLMVAYLAAPDDKSTMFIDLVQWLTPESTGDAYRALNQVGINRIAFRVSDIDSTTASLR